MLSSHLLHSRITQQFTHINKPPQDKLRQRLITDQEANATSRCRTRTSFPPRQLIPQNSFPALLPLHFRVLLVSVLPDFCPAEASKGRAASGSRSPGREDAPRHPRKAELTLARADRSQLPAPQSAAAPRWRRRLNLPPHGAGSPTSPSRGGRGPEHLPTGR